MGGVYQIQEFDNVAEELLTNPVSGVGVRSVRTWKSKTPENIANLDLGPVALDSRWQWMRGWVGFGPFASRVDRNLASSAGKQHAGCKPVGQTHVQNNANLVPGLDALGWAGLGSTLKH